MAGKQTVREMLVKIGVKVNKTEMDDLVDETNNLRDQFKKLIAVAAAAATAIVAVGHTTAAAGDDVAKASHRIGMSADVYQELAFAAKQAGAEAVHVEVSFRRLAVSIRDATVQAGGKAGLAFKKLGIDVKKMREQGASNVDFFEAIAEGMKNIGDATENMAIANDLLGRGGARLLPILDLGRDAIRDLRKEARLTSYIFSEEELANAEEYVDLLHEAKEMLLNFKHTAGVVLVPMMNDLLKAFRNWFERNGEIIKQRIEMWAKVFASIVYDLADAIGLVNDLFEAIGWGKIIDGVVISLTLLAGSKVWGMLVTAFTLVRGAAVGAAIASAQAWIAATAPVWLVVAAIAALLIAIQDVYYFVTGKGNSVLGAIFGDTDGFLKALDDVWSKFKEINELFLSFYKAYADFVLSFAGLSVDGIIEGVSDFVTGTDRKNPMAVQAAQTWVDQRNQSAINNDFGAQSNAFVTQREAVALNMETNVSVQGATAQEVEQIIERQNNNLARSISDQTVGGYR